MRELALRLDSRRDTRLLAEAVASTLEPGDVVWLEGELGAGKTYFARRLARALGVPSSVPVTSPTFALMHELRGRIPIRHLDLYRLGSSAEASELGVAEDAAGYVTVVEWGARFRDVLGDTGIELVLSPLDGAVERGRQVFIRALDARGQRVLDSLARAHANARVGRRHRSSRHEALRPRSEPADD
jgi:tRNA threonylcarbamoyladenosine biosynthesis protein TsaE